MYVAPSITEHVVELEQGIAAASPTGTPSATDNGFDTGTGSDQLGEG